MLLGDAESGLGAGPHAETVRAKASPQDAAKLLESEIFKIIPPWVGERVRVL